MEENIDIALDTEQAQPAPRTRRRKEPEPMSGPVNCLRNERVVARFLPRTNGIWGDNPRHVLSGGMAENATMTLVVPRLKSGGFVNILTNNEKECLEEVMGLEHNALSVHNKERNFWDDANESGVNKVTLRKQDNYFDLSVPEDYIRYKILLANKDIVAPSLQSLNDIPKATYRFVLVTEAEETKQVSRRVSTTMECYKEFGKIEDDRDVMRYILETIEGRPVVKNAKVDTLRGQVEKLIQLDSKRFHSVITDPLRDVKVLIRKCVDYGIVARRGNFYYNAKNNMPLCEAGQDPTMTSAAEYLSSIRNQDVKFHFESEVQEKEK